MACTAMRHPHITTVRMYVVKETQTPIFKSSDVASQHPPNFPAIVPDASSERPPLGERSEEHTSELQSLMRISYAVFCLKKKKHKENTNMRQQTLAETT